MFVRSTQVPQLVIQNMFSFTFFIGHWLQISKAEDVAFEIQKFLALK